MITAESTQSIEGITIKIKIPMSELKSLTVNEIRSLSMIDEDITIENQLIKLLRALINLLETLSRGEQHGKS